MCALARSATFNPCRCCSFVVVPCCCYPVHARPPRPMCRKMRWNGRWWLTRCPAPPRWTGGPWGPWTAQRPPASCGPAAPSTLRWWMGGASVLDLRAHRPVQSPTSGLTRCQLWSDLHCVFRSHVWDRRGEKVGSTAIGAPRD